MYITTVKLKGKTQYLQNKRIKEEKKRKETHEEHDARTWKQRMTVDEKTGNVAIPPMAIQKALITAANMVDMKMPDNKNAKYKKYIVGCIKESSAAVLNVKADDVKCVVIDVPSNGRAGGTTRVAKRFPDIQPGWEATLELTITDPVITREIFEKHIKYAGLCVGIGTMRSGNGYSNGMFDVEIIDWKEI